MIETLGNLRNNKLKPAEGVAVNAESALKKYIGSLAKKSSGTLSAPECFGKYTDEQSQ